MSKATPADVANAKRFGQEAHAAGRIRFPGADKDLMALCAGYPFPSGERAVLMAAWLCAYDARVCAALMSFDPNA